jgi:hypothetical protein
MASAALRIWSSAVGQSWLYVLSVVVAEACPSAFWTVTSPQPLGSAHWPRSPQVVELEPRPASSGLCGPPPKAHGVLVGWILALAEEYPPNGILAGPEPGDYSLNMSTSAGAR